MAAAIVVSGRDLSQLGFPLGLALVLFAVGLVAGVLLLHLLDRSSELHGQGTWDPSRLGTLLLIAALRDTDRDDATKAVEAAPKPPVLLAVLTIAARLVHMGLVAGGFALVIWSLAQEAFV